MYILCISILSGMVTYLIFENKQLKSREKRLEKKAQTDSLTKIYNRATVEYYIDDFLKSEDAKQGVHGLMLLDLDDFKQINDTYGHHVGDEVLIELAQLLKEKFRKTDIVGRMGGDEFLIFIKSMESEEQIVSYGNQIVKEVEKLHDIKVTLSMGICTKCGKDFSQMYMEADHALYEAKDKGKNTCFVYEKKENGHTFNT